MTAGQKAIIKAFKDVDPGRSEQLEAIAFCMPRGGVGKHSLAMGAFGIAGARLLRRLQRSREQDPARQGSTTMRDPGRAALALFPDQLEIFEVDTRGRPIATHGKFARDSYSIGEIRKAAKTVKFVLHTGGQHIPLEAPCRFSERSNADGLAAIAAAGTSTTPQ